MSRILSECVINMLNVVLYHATKLFLSESKFFFLGLKDPLYLRFYKSKRSVYHLIRTGKETFKNFTYFLKQ